MTDYQIYVFFLCLIVFVLLSTLSVVCISIITKLMLRLIDHGVEDEKILEEYRKKQNKKGTGKFTKLLDYAFSGIVCFVLLVALVGAFSVRFTESSTVGDIPVYRVVNTGSMAKKNAKNTYLTNNQLNDQIQTFDLIRTEKLPDEYGLELYDIVVYETDGMLIVHRIVEIEEPNELHPDCRYFKLQGDAVESPDRFPVYYSQMRAIYRGNRVPFIGSFILFMQSPAGWLCLLFVLFAVIAAPLLESKIQKAKDRRLLLYIKNEAVEQQPEEDMPPVEEMVVRVEIPRPIAVYAAKGRMDEIDLDDIDKNYSENEIVDIYSLKKKRLVSDKCKRVKVIANGCITKPITVKADGFSAQAIRAIESSGGTAIKVRAYELSPISADTEKIGGARND